MLIQIIFTFEALPIPFIHVFAREQTVFQGIIDNNQHCLLFASMFWKNIFSFYREWSVFFTVKYNYSQLMMGEISVFGSNYVNNIYKPEKTKKQNKKQDNIDRKLQYKDWPAGFAAASESENFCPPEWSIGRGEWRTALCSSLGTSQTQHTLTHSHTHSLTGLLWVERHTSYSDMDLTDSTARVWSFSVFYNLRERSAGELFAESWPGGVRCALFTWRACFSLQITVKTSRKTLRWRTLQNQRINSWQ